MINSWNVGNTKVVLYEEDDEIKLKINNEDFSLKTFNKITLKDNAINAYEVIINRKLHYLYLEDGKYYLLFNGKDVNTDEIVNEQFTMFKFRFLIYILQFVLNAVLVSLFRFFYNVRISSSISVLMILSSVYIFRKVHLTTRQKLIRIFFITLACLSLNIIRAFLII